MTTPAPKPSLRDELFPDGPETLTDVRALVDAGAYAPDPRVFWADCAAVTWGEDHPFWKQFSRLALEHTAFVMGCKTFDEQNQPDFLRAVLVLLERIFDALTRGLKAYGLTYDLD